MAARYHTRRPFLSEVRFRRERFGDGYPFNLPALRDVTSLRLHSNVTFLTGDNGSGKSTVLEAIAIAAGFNAEGGTVNFRFATRRSESPLHTAVTLVRTERRPKTGFFLRAESFYNVATNIEELDRASGLGPPVIDSYGGRSLHEQSHGESFWSLFNYRLGPDGLYFFDEPESALSPARQIEALRIIHHLVCEGSQFVIATHSPILLAYPNATILELGDGLDEVGYEQSKVALLYRDFLRAPEQFVGEYTLDDDDDERPERRH